MINYINYQTRFFLRPDIFCNKCLSLDTFGRNEGNFGEKKITLNPSFVIGGLYLLC